MKSNKDTDEEIGALRSIKDYCRDHFQLHLSVWDKLEQKAARTAGYSGIYAGISVFILSYIAKEYQQGYWPKYNLWLFVISTLCFVISIFFTLASQKVRRYATIPKPRDIAGWYVSEECEEKTEKRMLKLLSMKYIKASESLYEPISKKAKLIEISIYLQIGGLVSIGLFVLSSFMLIFYPF